MAIKYKVSDLAKDFNMQSKDLVAILADKLHIEKKSSSSLEENEVSLVFNYLTKENSVKNFDEYFATGASAREKAAAERQAEKDRKLAEQMAIFDRFFLGTQNGEFGAYVRQFFSEEQRRVITMYAVVMPVFSESKNRMVDREMLSTASAAEVVKYLAELLEVERNET